MFVAAGGCLKAADEVREVARLYLLMCTRFSNQTQWRRAQNGISFLARCLALVGVSVD